MGGTGARRARPAADSPKQWRRVCQKGKACGNGCISQERQCTKAPGCACDGSGTT
jgi:hypothetical protein